MLTYYTTRQCGGSFAYYSMHNFQTHDGDTCVCHRYVLLQFSQSIARPLSPTFSQPNFSSVTNVLAISFAKSVSPATAFQTFKYRIKSYQIEIKHLNRHFANCPFSTRFSVVWCKLTSNKEKKKKTIRFV